MSSTAYTSHLELYAILNTSADDRMARKAVSGRIHAPEKVRCLYNLGLMLASGLSLERSLSVLGRQTANPALKKIIANFSAELATGMTFSEALGAYPEVFSPVVVSVVRAGEESGTLSDSLEIAANHIKKSAALNGNIRGAFMFPSSIVGMLIVIGIFPFLKVFFQTYGLPVALGAVVILGLIAAWLTRSAGKRFLHIVLLNLPGTGRMVRDVNSARIARAMSSLLSSGLDVSDALRIASGSIYHTSFKGTLMQIAASLEKGRSLASVLNGYAAYYPAFFLETITVGQETKNIGEAFTTIASHYERAIERRAHLTLSAIELVLLVMVGVAAAVFIAW